MRIVRLAKAQNITSIADFIAARYGKSQAVAATVALIAIVGMIPYIALQLKAVSSSLSTILAQTAAEAARRSRVLGDIALFVALSMAAFAVLFGTRHIDATEHQDGLMLAVATELIVKLVAFLAVGVFVTFCDVRRAGGAVRARAGAAGDRGGAHARAAVGTFCAMTLLSLFAIVLLPRQFHVTVVENNSEAEIRRAAWLFPLYLVLINLFVVPIALAGLLTFPAGRVDSDMFVLALPLAAHSELFALVAFVGGLSAATAMVIVESVALAIMVSNDIVMPLVLQRRAALAGEPSDVGGLLLAVRRVAIFVDPVARLHLLSLGRRRAARLDRAAVVRRHRAARAGLFRRPDLAARHRARRDRRHDRRHPGLGLYAAAAELRRRRHRRRAHPDRRAVGARLAAAAGAVRARSAAAGARRRCGASALNIALYVGFSLRPRADLDRAPAGRPVRARRRWRRSRRASGCGAPRSRSRS